MHLTDQTTPSKLTSQRLTPYAESRLLMAVLASRAPLPSSALFIGLAEDGLPVLLNLRDHAPSPVLVAADAGAGKTRLLQTVARAIEHIHDPERVRFAVVTEHPNEWSTFECSSHCEGILAFHHALTTAYFASTMQGRWPASSSSASLVLLIDGFEMLSTDGDLRDAAHRFLQAPPPPGILPLVTLNTSGASTPSAWLDAFRVRLFGYVRERAVAASLCESADSFPGGLQPPYQFAAREDSAWLPFWVPEMD